MSDSATGTGSTDTPKLAAATGASGKDTAARGRLERLVAYLQKKKKKIGPGNEPRTYKSGAGGGGRRGGGMKKALQMF